MPGPARLLRRTTIGFAGASLLGVAAVGGCTDGEARPSDAATRAAARAAAASADAVVMSEARTQVADRLDLVRRTARRHGELDSTLRPLVLLHERHARLLTRVSGGGASVAAPDDAVRVPGSASAALALVRSQERALQTELVDLAVRASSGPLARALASMSAGVAQRAVLLSAAVAGPSGAGAAS